MKRSGIFIKVFIYTVLFSALLVGATAFLFLQQLQTYRAHAQIQTIVDSYQQIVDRSRVSNDIEAVAQRFYERNESFQFYITDSEGRVVYETPNIDASGISTDSPPPGIDSPTVIVKLDKDYDLHALRNDVFTVDYGKWVARVALISVAMLVACVIGALIFARQMTRPIKALANNTNRMANLKDVPPLPKRNDELGALTRDVYSMYEKLKQSISVLEDEVLRERELEEAQRYFFSAASHELKTPIAATSVLLEGMLENVGDYSNHPKYLRECMKMMDTQSRMISEILEIVRLNDGRIVPVPEKLDIECLIAGLLPEFQTVAKANDLRVVLTIPDGEACLADPKMLKMALSNIILNAVQNAPKGGEVRIWSEPSTFGQRLCVFNTGARIDDAVLSKLFDPFYRVDEARSGKKGRSGLGLTIVQKTLEAMNVDFALENATDGVLFWMDLPEAQAGAAPKQT